MTEKYIDKCINIFPEGRDYPCQFLSVGDKTYFIKFQKQDERLVPSSCCLWSKGGFWAPRPDVLKNMRYDRSTFVEGETIQWWILDIPLPGPFGYGLTEAKLLPKAFWFPVIEGWVQQEFYNFSRRKPDQSQFFIPKICRASIQECKL